MRRVLLLGVAALALSAVGCRKAAVRAIGGAAKAVPRAAQSTGSFGQFGELGEKAIEYGVKRLTRPTGQNGK
jgi:hypothetical protein